MKTQNEKLIKLAQEALIANNNIWIERNVSILDAYNGQIAALGVSIAMSGLCPALAIFYQDKPKAGTKRKANRRTVLDLISHMITNNNDNNYSFDKAEDMFRYVVGHEDELSSLKKIIIDSSIALKQVVRTYNLISNE